MDLIQNIHFDFCPLITLKNVNKLSLLKILIAGLLNILIVQGTFLHILLYYKEAD